MMMKKRIKFNSPLEQLLAEKSLYKKIVIRLLWIWIMIGCVFEDILVIY